MRGKISTRLDSLLVSLFVVMTCLGVNLMLMALGKFVGQKLMQ
jgi:hypothetical protein